MREPILSADDHAAWAMLQRAALAVARSAGHRRRVDQAKAAAEAALAAHPNAAVMWSGGKDSTVLTHLVCVGLGAGVPVYSEKDDLDYPGELAYVTTLANAWGADLRVVSPPFSVREWIAANAARLNASDDMHSRTAELSKAAFYEVVEDAGASHEMVMLGLRSEESRGRRMNRAARGLLYRKKPTARHPAGQVVCQPLADWSGMDVYAYLAANEIEPLPVYHCIAFMHRTEPWRVRKSWWLPGASARHGGIAWLRRYYPSLYQQLRDWMPEASAFA